MRHILPLGTALLLLPAAASAASFPCSKATTLDEKAVCADRTLSGLDDRMGTVYREAIRLMSGSDPDENITQKAVKRDQKAWLAERRACGGDTACLRTSYERRLAEISFSPAPASTSPAERFVGRFGFGGFMSLDALALRDGTVAVSVSGTEPKTARWVCGFTGIGHVAADGALRIEAADANIRGLIITPAAKGGLTIPDGQPNEDTSFSSCGNGGTIMLVYTRKR
ncbi:lysozyme inhibitor LprI family protein [Roseomonas genomospecies 6]|uniref:DUF1311 domain-containing protein n=1 Tax=Roseomonas genomospecies 6 TaxID=214106 RepID=A0A9W7KMV0_9PROT|nr:lysozyme inhibitor LprI family protein [Roseomonas genomospecies 6]KAA0675705.1 DUF1311 domain-containing protein [Roseomonas genomospecies 6]